MRMRLSSLLIFFSLIVPPNTAFPIEEGTNTKADLYRNMSKPLQEPLQDCQFLYQGELDGQLDVKNLLRKANIKGAQSALEEGIRIVSRLLITPKDNERDASHAQQLGFEFKDKIDIEKACQFLGNAFPVFEIYLSVIQNFAPHQKAEDLLSDTHQLLIPIKINETVKSSITIRFAPHRPGEVDTNMKEPDWRPTQWGRPKLIRRLTEEQSRLKPQKPGFLVLIPSLNRNFLGYKDDGIIKLVPLFEDHLFEAGQSYLAQDAFEYLSAEAKRVDDSPR